MTSVQVWEGDGIKRYEAERYFDIKTIPASIHVGINEAFDPISGGISWIGTWKTTSIDCLADLFPPERDETLSTVGRVRDLVSDLQFLRDKRAEPACTVSPSSPEAIRTREDLFVAMDQLIRALDRLLEWMNQ